MMVGNKLIILKTVNKNCFFLLFLLYIPLIAQTKKDSIIPQYLDTLNIKNQKTDIDITRLESVNGTYIYSGKKNEVIQLTKKNLALTEKYGRQIFAKIPGVFVYDMDGTGNQINISIRGLDPHRGWEFNTRKDGIITNSDMYGYPASHYNIPMEAVEKIELTRGTGSLQYGAQFGGMVNYVSKQPDTIKKFAFESQNTIGSYGLLSNFMRVSGKLAKFRYSVWVNKKTITGYRDNSDSKYDAQAISLFFDPNKNFHIKIEWTHSNYTVHLAGALTDKMFEENPKTATRSRNYYNPDIHIPSVTIDWKIKPKTVFKFTSSAVIGARNSVLFDKPTTTEDAINPITLQYSNRQVDIDHFNSYTTEMRLLHTYKLFSKNSTFTSGIQYMNNNLHRQQQGKGTTGSDFNLSLVTPGWGRDLNFKTKNYALFIENNFVLTEKFSVNAGCRIENGTTEMSGTTIYYSENDLKNKITHKYSLLGISAQYDIDKSKNFYLGWSQAYRPVIFKDIIPTSIYEVSDKNLKDAFGYNSEIGFRGKWKTLNWDASLFHLKYNNRMGTLAQTDNLGNLIIYKTNIGDSATKGLEFFLQSDFSFKNKSSISLFTSTSFMDGKYKNATIRSGNENIAISGNKIESVPSWISRNGVTYTFSKVSISGLYSYTSKSYADALNIEIPTKEGATGIVPSYQIVDLNFTFQLNTRLKLQFNVNNLFDNSYFTKRPQFYPGPGIWPSDGRTFSGTILVKL